MLEAIRVDMGCWIERLLHDAHIKRSAAKISYEVEGKVHTFSFPAQTSMYLFQSASSLSNESCELRSDGKMDLFTIASVMTCVDIARKVSPLSEATLKLIRPANFSFR